MARTGRLLIPISDLEANKDILAAAMPWFKIPEPYIPPKVGYEKKAHIVTETETVYVTSDHIPSPIGFESVGDRVIRHTRSIEAKALHQYYATNKMPVLLSDVPETLGINNLESLSSGHFVFFDKNTGVVHCVLDTHNRVALKWWYRYFDSSPQIVKMRGDKFARLASQDGMKVLTHNGTPFRWGTKGEIAMFIVNNKQLIMNGDTWDVYKQGAIFPEMRWNRPSTIVLSRVAMVAALYSNHK